MSKSPLKDFSRLLETNAKTAKKEESYSLPRYDTLAAINELRLKLDAALRHNTRLLDENSTLGEMANELRYELRAQQERFMHSQREVEETTRKTSTERQTLALELESKQRTHEDELSRLLREVSQLHEEKNQFEIEKAKEIEKLKQEFEGSLLGQLQSVRSCQNNSKDLYEIQIRSLKEQLEERDYEVENIKALERLEKNRLADAIKALEKELKHARQAHAIELQGVKGTLEQELHAERRRLESEKELEVAAYNLKVRRLKKDVVEKNLELEHGSKKLAQQEELVSIETTQFKKEKESLLSELKSNDLHSRNLLTREKDKLEELNRLEVENLTKLFETNIEELNGENHKLKQLIECKKQELKELYDENQRIKESYGAENNLIRNENNELKSKLKTIQLANREEMEAFKIKMASLLDADIKSMGSYYENQLKAYIDKVGELEKLNSSLKDRLYQAILDNDQIRKNFEIEVAKQRARVQDLKIKMASQQLEHKEQVSNLGSKVQLTSQTLIRETEHKDRTKGQYEEEKRKYHYLANSKDREIGELMAMMENMKRMHEDELKVLRHEKMQAKEDLQQTEEEMKQLRASIDEEMRLKDERLKTIVSSNEKEFNQIKELQDKIEVLEKNNLKTKKQLEHIQLVNASLAQELGLSKGFIESLQLESNAAIQDERSKLKAFLGTHEIGIREYFEDKIKSKEKDVDSLRKLLSEKEECIRELIVKYNGLQKRLELMMETQSKLRDFEEKVKNLGLDNNLVKNMAELFKK